MLMNINYASQLIMLLFSKPENLFSRRGSQWVHSVLKAVTACSPETLVSAHKPLPRYSLERQHRQ
jgi:hypothetical protein